jgi:hypothetical protein
MGLYIVDIHFALPYICFLLQKHIYNLWSSAPFHQVQKDVGPFGESARAFSGKEIVGRTEEGKIERERASERAHTRAASQQPARCGERQHPTDCPCHSLSSSSCCCNVSLVPPFEQTGEREGERAAIQFQAEGRREMNLKEKLRRQQQCFL